MAESMTPKVEAEAVAAKTTYASEDLQPLNLQARDYGDLDLLPAVPQPLARDEQLGQSENLGVQANGANPYWPPTSLGLVAGFKGTPIPAGPPPTLGKLPSGLEDTYRLRLDAKPYALDLGEDAPWNALGKNADIAVMSLQYALRGGIDPGVTAGFTPPPELRDARAWAASFPDGGFDLTDITRYNEYALRMIVGDENFNNYARWLTAPTPDRTKPAIMDFENRTLSPGGYTTPLDGIQGTLTLANNVLFATGSAWANQATTYGGSQDRFALGAGVITRERWTLGDVAPNTTLPRGFASADDFAQFGHDVRSGLGRAGYSDVDPILQGSSVTGKSFKTGQPFDVGRVSDFDVALAGDSMLAKAKELGIGLRSNGTRTGPLSARDLRLMGLRDMSNQLSGQVGREVNFMIYKDSATAIQRSPSIILPGVRR